MMPKKKLATKSTKRHNKKAEDKRNKSGEGSPHSRPDLFFLCLFVLFVAALFFWDGGCAVPTSTFSPQTLQRLADAGLDPARVPRHIAIIMDGNGRWARQRGLPRV